MIQIAIELAPLRKICPMLPASRDRRLLQTALDACGSTLGLTLQRAPIGQLLSPHANRPFDLLDTLAIIAQSIPSHPFWEPLLSHLIARESENCAQGNHGKEDRPVQIEDLPEWASLRKFDGLRSIASQTIAVAHAARMQWRMLMAALSRNPFEADAARFAISSVDANGVNVTLMRCARSLTEAAAHFPPGAEQVYLSELARGLRGLRDLMFSLRPLIEEHDDGLGLSDPSSRLVDWLRLRPVILRGEMIPTADLCATCSDRVARWRRASTRQAHEMATQVFHALRPQPGLSLLLQSVGAS